MLYTLTLNPSLDYIMQAPSLHMGETNRSASECLRYGGKGINVCAVFCALGGRATALFPIGGETGGLLLSLLKKENIPSEPIFIEGNTRINVKILSKDVTELNAAGPLIGERELADLLSLLDKLDEKDTLVISGSIPASVPKDICARIIRRLSCKGVRTVLDTSGEALSLALSARPYLIKPNESELKELVGDVAAEKGAEALQGLGARNVLVSLGKKGALLLSEDGTFYRAEAPKGDAKNTVGAGDSMLAGFLYAEEKGAEAALRFAVAAGSATAFKGALATKEEIEALVQKI